MSEAAVPLVTCFVDRKACSENSVEVAVRNGAGVKLVLSGFHCKGFLSSTAGWFSSGTDRELAAAMVSMPSQLPLVGEFPMTLGTAVLKCAAFAMSLEMTSHVGLIQRF